MQGRLWQREDLNTAKKPVLGTHREMLSDAHGLLTYQKALLEAQLDMAETSDLETEKQHLGLKRQSRAWGPRTEQTWGAGGQQPFLPRRGRPGPLLARRPAWDVSAADGASGGAEESPTCEHRAHRPPGDRDAAGLTRSTPGADILLPLLVLAFFFFLAGKQSEATHDRKYT